ncbi:MotA/TolQ/ExbB proton channel family protein [Roseitalea porphyridii]|uniref:Flagellar motor protein MotA n=1 Tax=Roseitalea porphyridii TaxID=1852022 RepID=A0A4P6V3D5_9HYPH|nr:MotA/TolQ/ExbB proton channel family protein [Roseitalea porphyridii]QBK31725.1 flagellar motor protein MotA [Roseitalea porphyridii]
MNAPAADDAAAKAGRRRFDPYRLSNPQVFLLSMIIFLVIVGFLAAILFRQISTAFMTNPGLNGLILGVLAVGIVLVFLQVTRLFREVSWVNSFKVGDTVKASRREPVLLAPMKAMLSGRQSVALTTLSMRSILDSIGTRLDESRDTSRYLIGLLVFLGLLGTFWGLLATIGSIGTTIQSLDPGTGDTNDILDSLKSGLSAPLEGMGTAFSSSLFGLSGSLVLGFLDLQAGRAQNRFYTELENWLSSVTQMDQSGVPLPASDADQLAALTAQIAAIKDSGGGSPRQAEALANLAEGVHGLVKSMRGEQQMMRDWVDAQARDQKATRETLDRLADLLSTLEKDR